MRLPYLRFANVVAHAQREVLRELPDEARSVPVIAYSVEASVIDSAVDTVYAPSWGEFWPPAGPIVIWQYPYEAMPEQEDYYRQIKAVLRHEYAHALGTDSADHAVGGPQMPRVRAA